MLYVVHPYKVGLVCNLYKRSILPSSENNLVELQLKVASVARLTAEWRFNSSALQHEITWNIVTAGGRKFQPSWQINYS